jgi:LysM repeat protein
MARIVQFLAVAALVAALSGCFRQAEDSFDAVTLESPPSSDGGPTSLPIVTAAVTNTPPLIVSVAPTDTPDARVTLPDTVTPTETITQIFITPGSPLNTLMVMTDTPTLGTPASVTPGGLITPTDAFNVEVGASVCEYTVQSGDTLFRIAVNNDTTVDEIRLANDLPNDTIFPGDILVIPNCGEESAGATEAAPDSAATPLPDGWQIHTVASGETLGLIAQRYGIGQSRIVAANSLANPDSLSVGQRLVIPAPE